MNSSEYEALTSKVARKMTNYTELVNYGTEKHGRGNKWRGASGFVHQIDVSLESNTDVLLVECKRWKSKVNAATFLALLARLMDIAGGPDAAGRRFRGALVTSEGFQSGVYTLVKHYKRCMSTFVVSQDGEFSVVSHTHFTEPDLIPSGERWWPPRIIQLPPDYHGIAVRPEAPTWLVASP